VVLDYSNIPTPGMRSHCRPPLCYIQNIRKQLPPPAPSYTTRDIRFFCIWILHQQRLLRQLISLLGSDYLILCTVENYPKWLQILTLGELMELSWIFVGDLCSVVSSKHTHLHIGGLTLLLLPLPHIQDVSAAVSASKRDHTPIQYY
jgi:hypothetical protein